MKLEEKRGERNRIHSREKGKGGTADDGDKRVPFCFNRWSSIDAASLPTTIDHIADQIEGLRDLNRTVLRGG